MSLNDKVYVYGLPGAALTDVSGKLKGEYETGGVFMRKFQEYLRQNEIVLSKSYFSDFDQFKEACNSVTDGKVCAMVLDSVAYSAMDNIEDVGRAFKDKDWIDEETKRFNKELNKFSDAYESDVFSKELINDLNVDEYAVIKNGRMIDVNGESRYFKGLMHDFTNSAQGRVCGEYFRSAYDDLINRYVRPGAYHIGHMNLGEEQRSISDVRPYFIPAEAESLPASKLKEMIRSKPDGWDIQNSYATVEDAIVDIAREIDVQHNKNPRMETAMPGSPDLFDGRIGGVCEVYENGRYAGKLILDREYQLEREKVKEHESRETLDDILARSRREYERDNTRAYELRRMKEQMDQDEKDNDGDELEF